MATTSPNSLQDCLSTSLPDGFHCKIRHVKTPVKRCEALYSPAAGRKPEMTRGASHFLAVTILAPANAVEKAAERGEVLVLGLEILTYYTKHLTTIFVSKADSTGYLPPQRPSPARQIVSTFISWIVAQEMKQRPLTKLVVSLFARSQSQYLFPGSAENKAKHILDDRQLIKWWTRVLDPLFPSDPPANDRPPRHQGYVTVPGYAGHELRHFFPPGPTSAAHWNPGHPLGELATTRRIPPSAAPRCLLPLFPDDPKARFVQDLDDEVGISTDSVPTSSPAKCRNGAWTTIRDLDQFWEAMEFRQECSSGRSVGFIWVVICPADSEVSAAKDAAHETVADGSPAPPQSKKPTSSAPRTTRVHGAKKLTGPIVPRPPRIKGVSCSLTAPDASTVDSTSGKHMPPESILLSREGYDRCMQALLHLDFAHVQVATQSTAKWVRETSILANIHGAWGTEVCGTLVVGDKAASGQPAGRVNDLGGMVRKKRKVEDGSSGNLQGSETVEKGATASVNLLSGGLVRKKAKEPS